MGKNLRREALVPLGRNRPAIYYVDDLKQRLLDFIEYFNKTMAKPFKWTYAGRPLVA